VSASSATPAPTGPAPARDELGGAVERLLPGSTDDRNPVAECLARLSHQQPRPGYFVQLRAQNVKRLPTDSGTSRWSPKALASDHALARDVHGQETFVPDLFVQLPCRAVERPAMLPGKPPLEPRHARDLATHVDRVGGDQLRLRREDHAPAVRRQGRDAGDVLHLQHGAVRPFRGARPEHVRVRVARDGLPAVAVHDQLQGTQHGAGVIPVTVRQHETQDGYGVRGKRNHAIRRVLPIILRSLRSIANNGIG